ncbi:hypothetical protein PINS_up017945 [Pythium insidiosum]|nr:hypothetical protein PINS_up017945 [Pythium insidiosum]
MESSGNDQSTATVATGKPPAAEDESLEALRLAILRSRQKKKEMRTDHTSKPSPNVETTAAPAPASSESASVTHNEEDTASPRESLHAPATTPLSPEMRPLTASSQSLVIRVSLDDMLSKRARKDSYDDVALRNPSAPVAELKRQIAAKEQELRVTRSGTASEVKGAQQAKRAAELEQSIAAMKKAIVERERARQSSSATETSSLPSMSPEDRSLDTNNSDLDTGLAPAQRAELKREYERCQREVEEADAHIARLDAKIAKVKAALATAPVQSAA